jgi:hypothetical protein
MIQDTFRSQTSLLAKSDDMRCCRNNMVFIIPQLLPQSEFGWWGWHQFYRNRVFTYRIDVLITMAIIFITSLENDETVNF